MIQENQPDERLRPPGRDRSLQLDCPILLTERLVLRSPHVEDIDTITLLANNPAIASMVSRMPHPYTKADAVDFVRKSAARTSGNSVYAMTETATGKFVGCCTLRPTADPGAMEIGYWVGEPYWRQGYATEAVHALVDTGFKTTEINHIDASCRVTNTASRRVLQKSGFQFQGSDMQHLMALNASVSVDRFRLDRKTWISLITWRSKAARP